MIVLDVPINSPQEVSRLRSQLGRTYVNAMEAVRQTDHMIEPIGEKLWKFGHELYVENDFRSFLEVSPSTQRCRDISRSVKNNNQQKRNVILVTTMPTLLEANSDDEKKEEESSSDLMGIFIFELIKNLIFESNFNFFFVVPPSAPPMKRMDLPTIVITPAPSP